MQGMTELMRIANPLVIPSSFEVHEILDRVNTLLKNRENPYPNNFTPTVPVSGPSLADAFATIESKEDICQYVVLHPRRYADLRKFGRDILDIESRKAFMEAGIQACLWGARIITKLEVPENEVLFFGRNGYTSVTYQA
jgi:hypothetical protein